jgi:putative zinc finger/helix-turn-helix YgiT family protein
VQLFEYPCPECGRGTVQTTHAHNYKTKIKGFPFRVDEALIGVCDHCQAESFAPEETQRWEAAFHRTLEDRHAFLTPTEIRALRTSLALSLEDFARLIGCTRQSVMAWEHPDRTTPPSRMADLLLRLLQRAWTEGVVDVTTLLVEEAKKWGVMIELRRTAPSGTTRVVRQHG